MRSFRKRHCCCCCRAYQDSSDSAATYITYRRRYENVPMQIYYGRGYSETDALEDINASLRAILAKLE